MQYLRTRIYRCLPTSTASGKYWPSTGLGGYLNGLLRRQCALSSTPINWLISIWANLPTSDYMKINGGILWQCLTVRSMRTS